MAIRTVMTWDHSKRRWQKMYKGRWFKVSALALGCPETKEASYQAAKEWWIAKRAEIDGQASPHPHLVYLAELDKRIGWTQTHGNDDERGDWEAKRKALEAHKEADDLTTDPRSYLVSEAARKRAEAAHLLGLDNPDPLIVEGLYGENWTERLDTKAIPEIDRTIGGQIDSWLAIQEARVKAGEASPGHLTNLRLIANHFRAFAGEKQPIERVDAQLLAGYHAHLLGLIGDRQLSPAKGFSRPTAAKYMGAVRSFVRHLWSMNLIDLPRNLDSKSLVFKVTAGNIPTMPLGDVKTLIEAAKGQLKLHLMLMLNCGFTQTDCADLLDKEVDWANGRIVRKRSKTGDVMDVPTVNYKLWPNTFDLLKRYRSCQETVLLTSRGNKWAWEEIDTEGKVRSNDSIATEFNNLRTRMRKIDKKREFGSLKLFRKTASSMLDSHEHYGRYGLHFLGHSPRSIKDRHYSTPSSKVFDEALVWLGKQFGY